MPPPTLDFIPQLAQAALVPDPQQSTPTEPSPRHSAPLICASKRKRQFYVSQDEDPHPPTASQLQENLNSSFSTTTTSIILNSPVTSRVIRDRPRGRCGSLSVLSTQHGLHEKTPSTQLAPDGYSAGHNVPPRQQSPVGSIGEPYAKRRRVDNGQSPTWLGVAETNAHSAHTYTYTHVSAHTPTQMSTYAGPINTAPPQWTSGGNFQGPEHYYYNTRPTTCVQPAQMRANHQSPLNSTMHTTRTHDAHTPTGPPCSGFSLQSTPPSSPEHVSLRQTPQRATEPLRTRPASSPDEPRSITGGCTPLSSVFPLVLSEPSNLFPGDDPIGWPLGPLATDYMLNFPPPNGSIAWDGAICTTHSQAEGSHARGEDAPFSSYHYEEPISTPKYNQSLSSILIPIDHLLPSAPLWSTPDGFSLVEDPSPQLPRPFLQANLTASGHTPNSGGGQNCSDVNFNVDTAHSNGNPVSFKSNHQVGSNRSGRTHTKRESKPYQRPTPSVTPKTRPVKYDDNLERLQERCRKQGADEGAIGLLGKVFANEVSEAALMRSLTDEEVETRELGIVTGKVYTVFLEPTNEGKGAAHRYICRLCHSDQTWKNAKDVVRHLKRDHFGFADSCEKCGQKSYTKGEGTRHRCK